MARRPPPTPGEIARAEAAEHRGLGKSAIARAYRDRRIYQLAVGRRQTVEQIAEATGWTVDTVKKALARIAREASARISTWDLQKDAALQLDEFDEMKVQLLEELAQLPIDHRNRPKLRALLLDVEKAKHVFLERVGLRKPIDQGGPPDASDLRGKPTQLIEEELARIAESYERRRDPKGYLEAVRRMRDGDVIDVQALPEGEPE